MAKKRTASADQAILQEITAHPEEDAPRLVYADWLDDHGQSARAEFIRLQIRLARMSEEDPERPDLLDREEELLRRHPVAWRADLPAWARREWPTFRRGFVDSISVTATQFLRHGDALFRVAPLEGLGLRAVAGQLAAALASPHLKQLTALDLRENHLADADVPVLTASPHLARLTDLNLRKNDLAAGGMGALAGWRQ